MTDKLSKILMAEDESDIQAVAKLALESIGGFDVKMCDNGQLAIDAINEFQPDLILLDYMMPELDGPSTIKKLKANNDYANIPVIFLTAKSREDEIKELIDLGAIGVINKPFDPMSLADTINNHWRKFATK